MKTGFIILSTILAKGALALTANELLDTLKDRRVNNVLAGARIDIIESSGPCARLRGSKSYEVHFNKVNRIRVCYFVNPNDPSQRSSVSNIIKL